MPMRRLLLTCALVLPGIASAACPPDAAIAQLAEAVVTGRPVEPLAGLSMADAECARDKLVPLLVPAFGKVNGYKAGLTNAAVQRRYGLDRPVRGMIFAGTLGTNSGAEVPLTPPLAGIGVEPDLLVRVKDDGINTAGTNHVAILRHIDLVIPFIELPRSPYSRAPDGPALVAANVHARLGVVGTPIQAEATEEFARRLGSMTVVFSDNEREVARASGTALLEHPLNVIPWLVEDLVRSGQRLQAGDIVSLGGFAPSVPAQAGHSYSLRYEGLTAEPVGISVRFR